MNQLSVWDDLEKSVKSMPEFFQAGKFSQDILHACEIGRARDKELVRCYRAMNRILLDAIPCPETDNPRQYVITDFSLDIIKELKE